MKAPDSINEVGVNQIRNKIKRQAVFQQLKARKTKEATKARKERQKQRRDNPDVELDVPIQITQENIREPDETLVQAGDEEIDAENNVDEFAAYFAKLSPPKIAITTSRKPTSVSFDFISDLLQVIPNSSFYKRRGFEVKAIVREAIDKGFTDLIVINEDRKQLNGLLLIHLPGGPTAHFKLTNVTLNADIAGHGVMTPHQPELILNNFNSRLGNRLGRMLAALFDPLPEFRGRRVVTFHNQRDFVFFRQHRYMFDDQGRFVDLQELGPRFTLKLKSLQHGTFDSTQGEYEWKHHPDQNTSRRRFFL